MTYILLSQEEADFLLNNGTLYVLRNRKSAPDRMRAYVKNNGRKEKIALVEIEFVGKVIKQNGIYYVDGNFPEPKPLTDFLTMTPYSNLLDWMISLSSKPEHRHPTKYKLYKLSVSKYKFRR